jgi:hypothetical protein
VVTAARYRFSSIISAGSFPFFCLSLFYRSEFHQLAYAPRTPQISRSQPTWRTKIANVVFSPSLPSSFCACCTSFCSSRTAYSSVVRVSSTSSTIKTLFPIRFAISRELRSSHCVRVTFVPGCSTTPPLPRSSYRESPIAWMGMLGEPGRLRKDLFHKHILSVTK